MNIENRICLFNKLFDNLMSTNSRLEKEYYVSEFIKNYPELVEDWEYILETLDNRHPIGWTYEYDLTFTIADTMWCANTIKELIQDCEKLTPKTENKIKGLQKMHSAYGIFLAPIVNRTLRLGIGKSLLDKVDTTPMLAKKYNGEQLKDDVVVTEKLDGNRCIAKFNNDIGIWEFKSRNGKLMNVNFDMDGFDTRRIYDGEVMSRQQSLLTLNRFYAIMQGADFVNTDSREAQLLFNETSGLINRKSGKKDLVYNIFDTIDDTSDYETRRNALVCEFVERDPEDTVRLLPQLYKGNDINIINNLLDRITDMGGEGIMLNKLDRTYENKRTDALLKYKQVQRIDMLVTDVEYGQGKYDGLIGALCCEIFVENGERISCKVGSGLSDDQRYKWALNPQDIIGKIIEVAYHEITSNKVTGDLSLRFPRLIRIRTDKTNTSEY